MPRCDIHELLPYAGDTCPDCTDELRQPAETTRGPWRREDVAASEAEEPEPFVIHLG